MKNIQSVGYAAKFGGVSNRGWKGVVVLVVKYLQVDDERIAKRHLREAIARNAVG
jgi:hypothetical protein